MKKLTIDRARELVSYDADTGAITWNADVGSRAKAGVAAGTERKDGYIIVRLDGEQVLAHRLAWFLYHGVWPKQQIDHANRDRADNRIINLRDIAPRMNQQNMKRRSDNTTGFTGVYRKRGKFRAQLTYKSKTYSGGVHDTPGQAYAAYLKLKQEVHELR